MAKNPRKTAAKAASGKPETPAGIRHGRGIDHVLQSLAAVLLAMPAKKEIQRGETNRSIVLLSLNLEPSLSPNITSQEKKIFSARGAFPTAPRQNG